MDDYEPRVPAYIVKQALAPNIQWRDRGKMVHEWRTYVGHHTQKIWYTFTDEQKIALAADADHLAGLENWD